MSQRWTWRLGKSVNEDAIQKINKDKRLLVGLKDDDVARGSKSIRVSPVEQLNEALLAWLKLAKASKLTITDNALISKAK